MERENDVHRIVSSFSIQKQSQAKSKYLKY